MLAVGLRHLSRTVRKCDDGLVVALNDSVEQLRARHACLHRGQADRLSASTLSSPLCHDLAADLRLPPPRLWNHWTDLHDFLCRSHVAVARSSSGSVVMRYVPPSVVACEIKH